MNEYILFCDIINLNQAPINAAKTLLSFLQIPYTNYSSNSKDLGFELDFLDGYCDIFKPVLIKAQQEHKTILALELSSYLGLKKANDFFNLNIEIKSVNEIVLQYLKPDFKHDFNGFKASIYQAQPFVKEILKHTKLSLVTLDTTYQNDGYFLLNTDKDIAFKMASEIVYDTFDKGSDMLIVDDIRAFYIFDNFQNNLAKTAKRVLGEYGLNILFLTEILCLAYGLKDDFSALHKTKISFIS